MIVANQNRYNNLFFDLLPVVYLEFRHAELSVTMEKQKNIIL